MVNGLKGILFDSDGVLVDSERIYFRAVRDTFRNYGVEISQDEYVRRWMIEQTISKGAIEDYKLQATLKEVRELKERFEKEYIENLQIMPGALELLQRVHGKYPLGVITSARRKELLRKIERFDLMKFFKISVTGEEVENRKPHPEPYQRGCQLLGLNPQNVLVIEDNPTGIQSAEAAGCKTIAYPNGFTEKMDFSLADRVVKSLDEIDDEMLIKLFSN